MSTSYKLQFFRHLLVGAAVVGAGMTSMTAYAQSGRGGEQNFSGQITNSSPSNDGSRYQVRTITLEAGKRYAISANSSDFDTKIRLSFADDNDETLAEDDDGGDGTNSLLEYIPARTGTHRVRVTSFNDNIGSYNLTVKSMPALPALLRPTPTKTSRIEFQHFAGELTASDAVVRDRRVDDYVFSFAAGKPVFIYMDRINSDIDPQLSVHLESDRNGNSAIASDDDGGQDLNSFLNFIPETSGRYIVRASSMGDANAAGKYELRVGQQP